MVKDKFDKFVNSVESESSPANGLTSGSARSAQAISICDDMDTPAQAKIPGPLCTSDCGNVEAEVFAVLLVSTIMVLIATRSSLIQNNQ